MSVISNNQLAGASGQGGSSSYEISRSLRFNSEDSNYLSRTPSSAGNRRTWTLSFWIKRSKVGDEQMVFSAADASSNRLHIYFPNEDRIAVYSDPDQAGVNTWYYNTTALARDPSAWMHLVFACDTTQATANDRFKIYVNGVLIDSYHTRVNPPQNNETVVNSTILHQFSGRAYNTNDHFDGYLADVHFIDGQALAATDFGKYDNNNIWQPKEYSGSYGTNGFHLDFSDNSSDSALGTDAAGSNNWTVNNLYSASTAPAAKSSISYAIAPTDFPGTSTNNQSSLSFSNTWSVGNNLTIGSYIIIDTGAKGHSVDLTPFSSDASISYSDNLINWTTGASTTANSDFTEGRYYWIQSTPSAYGGGLTLTSASTADGDSMIDTPTNIEASSGNDTGNYCTWNPLDFVDVTLSNGNLDCSLPGSSPDWVRGTFAVTSGKWYWEVTLNSGVHGMIGISDQQYTANALSYTQGSLFYYVSNGNIYGDVGRTGGASSYGSGLSAGDVLGVALDMDNGNVKFYKNGSAFSGNANTSTLVGKTITPCLGEGGGAMDTTTNFGQRTFAYTPPTGYKPLCTTSFSDPTIADGSTAMDVLTWNGNDTQRNITGLGFSPDLVWIKQRSGSANHSLMDTVRGATKNLVPNDTQAEGTEPGYLNAFLSNGFSIGTSSVVNDGSSTYVGWAWDGGSSNTSVSAGSLNSSSYNQDSAWSSTSGLTNASNAFDGDLSTGGLVSSSGTAITITTASFTGRKIRFYKNGNNDTTLTTITVNGSNYTFPLQSTATGWVEVDLGSSTTVTSFTTTWYGSYTLYAIEVDGKILVDSSATPPNVPTLASTVRADASAGFSIVSYNGDNNAGDTVGHGLNAAPGLIIIKNRDDSFTWYVYHSAIGATKYLRLDTTNSATTGSGAFNNTAPTSSVFSLGQDNAVNDGNKNYIAYCFSPVSGFSSFGTYRGNGSADGPFVYTGHRSRFLLIKADISGEDWVILDTARETSNVQDAVIFANLSSAEVSATAYNTDILSNGFKLRGGNPRFNSNNGIYYYASFAEHPFKNSRAR